LKDRTGPVSAKPAKPIQAEPSYLSLIWPVACLLIAAGWWLFSENGPSQVGALASAFALIAPIGPHFLLNLAQSILGCLLGLSLYLLYDACGTGLSRWLTGREPSGIVRLASAPLAFGAVSPALLGAAANGLWYRPVLAGMLALLAVFSAAEIPRSFRRMTGTIARMWDDSNAWARAGWIILALAFLFFIAPPEINPDSMQYHLSFPQQLLAGHRLPNSQVFWFWLIPLPMEFPGVFALMAGSDAAIRVLFILFAFSGATAVLRSIPFRLGPALTAAAALAALALHDSSWVATTCKNDLPAAAFGLLGGALLASRAGTGRGQTLLGALLLGYCWAAKFVLGPLAFLLAGIALLYNRRNRLAAVGLLALGLFLPVLPWIFRSYLACGDPLFPAGTMFFPQWTGTPWRNADLLEELMKFQEKRARSLFLSDTGRALLILSPMFLAGLPALLRARAWGVLVSTAALALAIALQFLLMPASSYAIFRFDYLAGMMLFLFGFSAVFGERASPVPGQVPGHYRTLAAVVCSAGLLAGISHTAWWHNASYQKYINQADYPSGRLTGAEYRTRGLFSFGLIIPEIDKAVKALPPYSSIIEMGDTISWGVAARMRNDTVGPHPIWEAVYESDSPARLEVKFRQMNARLLLYNSEKPVWAMTACVPYAWTPRMLVLYADYVRRHVRRLACTNSDFPTYGTLWLYEMLPRAGKPAPMVDFLPGAERALCLVKRTKAARDFPTAFALLDDLRKMLPGIRVYDSIHANLLFLSGRLEESYPELMKQLNVGFNHDISMNQAMVTAYILGKKAEGDRLYRMALAWYPTRKADIDYLLKMPAEQVRKGQYLQ